MYSVRQCLSLDKSHCVGEKIGRFLDGVDWHDVGVRKARRRSRLEEESVAQRGLRCELGRQDLQRDWAIEADVSGEVNRAHPATAQLALERVAIAEGGANEVDRCCCGGRGGGRHRVNMRFRENAQQVGASLAEPGDSNR